MSSTFDRQIRPIYDALDTGSNKSAIVACNKLLKKQPQNDLVKALKALALVRSQKVEESLVICDEVLASKPSDDSTLNAMSHVLRGLGRHMDIIVMYESAWKQSPGNEELGVQTFNANIRTGNWKIAQQVATKLHKQFKEERYLYWSIFCAILQANDPATPAALRPVLYKLAHRLITSASTPSYYSADRFFVNIWILKELELWDDATALLSSEIGQAICNTSLTCNELRRDVWKRKGSAKEEGERAQSRILEKDDRNWLEFLSILDATFWEVTSAKDEPSEEAKTETQHRLAKAQEFFAQIADKDGVRDRSGPLALLELEKRANKHHLSTDPDALFTMVDSYFRNFGDKACCYEDLQPFVTLFTGDDLAKWTAFLETQASTAPESLESLRRTINAFKLLRYTLPSDALTVDAETARVTQYTKAYFHGLDFGKTLAETELQPADDLAVLAGQTFVNLWKISQDVKYLYNAVTLLEYATTKSKESYHIRLLLIRIYTVLGAPSLALEHYRAMNVKQVQTDTLSYLVLSRAATFALSAIGDLTYSTECMESSQIYLSNSTDTAEFVVRAFMAEKYSQIPDFVALEDGLDNSLQRDLMKMEHVRMRLAHESINTELVDMELIELKFIFDRLHYDNRDFDIIPNYQPHGTSTFEEQTRLFNKNPGQGWLSCFLKIYIKAFQLASDIDETVEDKLLIGDRPKPHAEFVNGQPLNDRLASRTKAELDDLTPDELSMVEFATEVNEWLEAHHNYIRPPPSVVLAEAARLSELKTGQQAKFMLPAATNGNGSSNGQTHKKDEESPAVQEPPELVVKFFDNMKERFNAAASGGLLPPELLHIATLTQEALLIFSVLTNRFKPAAIVKQHRLGNLVQSFKEIRTNACTVLNDMATELKKRGEAECASAGRTAIIDACKLVEGCSELDLEFVSGVAKKVVDARKAVLGGISTGITKITKTYAN